MKFGYKQTEIGLIPEDWDIATLSSVADVTSGKRLPLGTSLQDNQTPHPYIRVADMYPGGVQISEIKYVPVHVYPLISQYRIFAADLFISVAGTLGIVGSIPQQLDGANLTENANRIRPIRCDRDYLKFVLLSARIQATVQNIQTVGAQPKLALTRLREFLIPLPCAEEQRAIAAVLTAADAEIAGLERLIAKKRDLKEAALQQLLTGQTRLSGFSGEWTQSTIGAVSQIYGRIGFRGYTVDDIVPEGQGALSLSPSNIQGNALSFENKTFVSWKKWKESPEIQIFDGDTILVKTGSTVGKAAFVHGLTEPATLNPQLVVLKNPKVDKRLLGYIVGSEGFQRQLNSTVVGGALPTLSQRQIATYRFAYPSCTIEQCAIAEALADADAEIAGLERLIAKKRDLKQGMMQELLTGRIRLPIKESVDA